MKIPTVSVIMATYNHQDYVATAIESVLIQQDVDFEFLITDDGSTDSTPNIVSKFTDKRISYFPSTLNRGACTATNELIARARGEYIAIINSDDCWSRTDKLVLQRQFLECNPDVGATFSKVNYIDKYNNIIPKSELSGGDVFDKKNRSRGEWLRYFFDHGNALCHPSVLIRKKLYNVLGAYNNRLRQLPDFFMWLQLVKHMEIYIEPIEFVNFRIIPGENVSSPHGRNLVRDMNEHLLIANSFFDGVSSSLLHSGFSDLMINKAPTSETQLEIEKVLILFNSTTSRKNNYKMIGFIKLFNMLNDPLMAKLLNNDYSIDDKWFQERAGNIFSQQGLKSDSNWKKFRRRLKNRILSIFRYH
jgi:glycosyltransferase involved in cell wall biosynthesis